MENRDFDKLIREKLGNHEMPYDPNDWDLMENALDEAENKRRRLIIYKLVELTLLILVVFTAVQFIRLGGTRQGDAPKQNHNSAQKESPIIAETPRTYNDIEGETLESIPSKGHSLQDLSSDDSNASKNTVFNEKEKNIPVSSPYSIFDEVEFNNEYSNPANNNIVSADENTSSNEEISLEEKFKREIRVLSEVKDEFVKEIKTNNSTKPASINTPKNAQYRLGVFASLDGNNIIEPYFNQELGNFQQTTFGYSIGANISRKIKNLDIETGLQYSRKSYAPREIASVEGSISEGFFATKMDQIETHVVSLPLNARYTFKKTPRLQFYATSGVALNVVGWTNIENGIYDLAENTNNNDILLSSRLATTNEYEGWFNGGRFDQNYFITTNVGFGLEYRANEKLSIFAQPTYAYQFTPGSKGLGPNNERYHTFSLGLGTRIDL